MPSRNLFFFNSLPQDIKEYIYAEVDSKRILTVLHMLPKTSKSLYYLEAALNQLRKRKDSISKHILSASILQNLAIEFVDKVEFTTSNQPDNLFEALEKIVRDESYDKLTKSQAALVQLKLLKKTQIDKNISFYEARFKELTNENEYIQNFLLSVIANQDLQEYIDDINTAITSYMDNVDDPIELEILKQFGRLLPLRASVAIASDLFENYVKSRNKDRRLSAYELLETILTNMPPKQRQEIIEHLVKKVINDTLSKNERFHIMDTINQNHIFLNKTQIQQVLACIHSWVKSENRDLQNKGATTAVVFTPYFIHDETYCELLKESLSTLNSADKAEEVRNSASKAIEIIEKTKNRDNLEPMIPKGTHETSTAFTDKLACA